MLPFKRAGLVLAIFCGLALAGPAQAAPKQHKHTIKMAARPFKALGHQAKTLTVSAGLFSFAAFDTAVIDPFGVSLQAVADGLDMFIAAPLESLPEPFEAAGDGVHKVYLGLDKVGVQLAK